MFDSIGAGVRSLVVGTGVVGSRFYLDNAPTDAVPPYCTYNDNVGTAPIKRGDTKVTHWNKQVQIDLWSTYADDDVADEVTIREVLNGGRFQLTGGVRLKTRVTSVSRISEPQGDNLIHRAFTVEVHHPSQAG